MNLFRFAIYLALCTFGYSACTFALSHGAPVSLVVFTYLLTVCTVAWHIAQKFTTGHNW